MTIEAGMADHCGAGAIIDELHSKASSDWMNHGQTCSRSSKD